jgi:hypothetical protein
LSVTHSILPCTQLQSSVFHWLSNLSTYYLPNQIKSNSQLGGSGRKHTVFRLTATCTTSTSSVPITKPWIEPWLLTCNRKSGTDKGGFPGFRGIRTARGPRRQFRSITAGFLRVCGHDSATPTQPGLLGYYRLVRISCWPNKEMVQLCYQPGQRAFQSTDYRSTDSTCPMISCSLGPASQAERVVTQTYPLCLANTKSAPHILGCHTHFV